MFCPVRQVALIAWRRYIRCGVRCDLSFFKTLYENCSLCSQYFLSIKCLCLRHRYTPSAILIQILPISSITVSRFYQDSVHYSFTLLTDSKMLRQLLSARGNTLLYYLIIQEYEITRSMEGITSVDLFFLSLQILPSRAGLVLQSYVWQVDSFLQNNRRLRFRSAHNHIVEGQNRSSVDQSK